MLKRQEREIEKLMPEAYEVYVKNTPKRTGNARKSTTLKDDTIVARYPYAQQLDEGASRQSPDGMSKPTQEYLVKRFKQIMNRNK